MIGYEEAADLGPFGLLHALEVRDEQIERLERQLERTEAELRATRDRYADIYDGSPSAHLTLSAGGRILEANLATAGLFGVERSALLGQSIEDWVEDDRAETWRIPRPSGDVVWVRAERIAPRSAGRAPDWAKPRSLVLVILPE
jgi:PAS domain-containing protein